MDSASYLRSLVGWNSAVDLSADGFCYVELIRVSSRKAVGALLGPWPTLASLLALGDDLFDNSCLSWAKYQVCASGMHVVVGGDQPGEKFYENVLVPASQGFCWPSFSLGARLCRTDGHPGDSRVLATRVGGYKDLVKPSSDDKQACLEYNRAVAVLSYVEKMEEYTRQGYSVEVIERLMRTVGVSSVDGQNPFVYDAGNVPVDHARGPNWERNRAAKAVQRVRRQESREKYVAAQAVKNYKDEQEKKGDCRCSTRENKGLGGQGDGNRAQGMWRNMRTPEEEELHKLRVERQIIQEKRKLEKLKSPTQIMEDAMRMVDFAQKCAKQQNDSKVAAWAAALSEASAESIAKSGSMPSVESLSSVRVKTVSSKSTVSEPVVSDMGDAEEKGKKTVNSSSFGYRVRPTTKTYEEFVAKDSDVRIVEDVDGTPIKLKTVPAHKVRGTQIDGNAVTTSGRSIDSNGVAYTRETAAKWVKRYHDLIRKHASIAKSEEQIAKDAKISVAEVRKYYRLRKEFGL